ncbi:MAG TPA: DUF3891 family protein [Gaiellaceae bacterium]|jgi:hypothetical protein
MLLRYTQEGTIVIGQPAHAWVAGQLARAWAGEFAPWEEVCLAAEQHDVGWTSWEAAPERDPDTGLPYSFGALPPLRRLELWSGAAAGLLSQSRYAALLVSHHGTLLVDRFPPAGDAGLQAVVDAYLARERAFQDRVLETLRADPAYAAHATDEAVAANRELVFTWDGLSLAVSHGVAEERKAVGFTLAPVDGGPDRIAVDPWPFRAGPVEIIVEGRLLEGPYADEDEMRRALERARWVTIRAELTPA